MNEKKITTEVHLCGMLSDDFVFSHQINNVRFYAAKLMVRRLSGAIDEIDIIVSTEHMDAERTYKGRYLEIYGQMRSRNTDSHVMLYILVTQDIGCLSAVGREADDDNRINLCGYICKKGIMRKTSRGIVYNFIVAVNYSGRRTSYLPCIVWGDKAKEAEMLHIGDKISAKGRIQSRIYRRKEESREIDHITHEVCLNTFQKDSREADGNEKEC